MSLYGDRWKNKYFSDNVNYTYITLGVVTKYASVISFCWGMSLKLDRVSDKSECYGESLHLVVRDRVIRTFNNGERNVIYNK